MTANKNLGEQKIRAFIFNGLRNLKAMDLMQLGDKRKWAKIRFRKPSAEYSGQICWIGRFQRER